MGVRSLGNALATFKYKFGRTGLEAALPPVLTREQLRTKGTAIGDMTQNGGLAAAFAAIETATPNAHPEQGSQRAA